MLIITMVLLTHFQFLCLVFSNFIDDRGISEGNVPAGSFGDVVDCLGNVVDKSDVDYHKGFVDTFFVHDLLASFGLLPPCHQL